MGISELIGQGEIRRIRQIIRGTLRGTSSEVALFSSFFSTSPETTVLLETELFAVPVPPKLDR